jgi:hypothetical protein
MSNNNEITISIENIEKMIKELSEIANICSTPKLKAKVAALQKVFSSLLDSKDNASAEDVIYEKMIAVKNNNPDLHLKLYMLYRNLTSGKISEVDAMDAYESYLSMFPSDVMVF